MFTHSIQMAPVCVLLWKPFSSANAVNFLAFYTYTEQGQLFSIVMAELEKTDVVIASTIWTVDFIL